jgi:hypothetical protein
VDGLVDLGFQLEDLLNLLLIFKEILNVKLREKEEFGTRSMKDDG